MCCRALRSSRVSRMACGVRNTETLTSRGCAAKQQTTKAGRCVGRGEQRLHVSLTPPQLSARGDGVSFMKKIIACNTAIALSALSLNALAQDPAGLTSVDQASSGSANVATTGFQSAQKPAEET